MQEQNGGQGRHALQPCCIFGSQNTNMQVSILQSMPMRCNLDQLKRSFQLNICYIRYASEPAHYYESPPLAFTNMLLGRFCGVALIPPPAQAALQMHDVCEASLQTE